MSPTANSPHTNTNTRIITANATYLCRFVDVFRLAYDNAPISIAINNPATITSNRPHFEPFILTLYALILRECTVPAKFIKYITTIDPRTIKVLNTSSKEPK